MKLFYKLFFLLNLLLLFPFKFLKANEGIGEIMNTHVGTVREEAKVGEVSVGEIVGYGIRLLLQLLATIFLVLVIIAGIKWMTAGGNQETITKAGKSLKEAIIGLIIVLAAYAITWFIFSQLQIAGNFGVGSGLPGSD